MHGRGSAFGGHLAHPVKGAMGAKVRMIIKDQPSMDYYDGEKID